MAKKQQKRTLAVSRVLVVAFVAVALLQRIIAPEGLYHIAVQLVARTLIGLGLLVAIWRSKQRDDTALNIATSALVLILAFAGLVLPDAACLLLYMLLLIGMIGVSIYAHAADIEIGGTFSAVWIGEIMALFIYLTMRATRYSYIDISFWQLSLAVGIPTGIAITVKWLWKGTSAWGRIGWLLLTSFLAALTVWMGAMHLNYALDFGKPDTCDFVIEDKDMHRGHGRHRTTTYKFILVSPTTSDRITLNVSSNEYRAYEIGDAYPVKRYDGAFDEPFYISGKYAK